MAEEGTRTGAARHPASRRRRAAVAGGAVVAIGALDLVHGAANWPVVVVGLLDEPAHVLTAYVLLLAMGRPLVPGRRDAWVLTGALLIDVDHLPLFLGRPGWAVAGGRPPTHSLALVLVLLCAGLAGRRAAALRYLAVGVLLHFVRDLVTGPGVPLLWPLGTPVRLPYEGYAALLCLAAAACVRGTHGLSPAAPPSARAGPPMPM